MFGSPAAKPVAPPVVDPNANTPKQADPVVVVPDPVAPTDAVQLAFDKKALTWTANITNSAAISGNCTYAATNPILPGVNKTFALAANGSASFSVPAPPPLSSYHVVVSCKGDFNGKTVEFGHVEQDV